MRDFYTEIECRRAKINDPEYDWMLAGEFEVIVKVVCEIPLQFYRF